MSTPDPTADPFDQSAPPSDPTPTGGQAPAGKAPKSHGGGDVVIDPADLDRDVPTPATSDPAEMVDGGELGGVSGQGGAG